MCALPPILYVKHSNAITLAQITGKTKRNCVDVANDEMLSCVKRIQRDLADHVTADRR